MNEFQDTKFYKLLQDFFINNTKETFIQLLAEFYNKTQGIIDKNELQDELIKELREMYMSFIENGTISSIISEELTKILNNNNLGGE